MGNGTNTDSNIPVQVAGIAGISSIEMGINTGFAVKSDGTVYSWGWNAFGILGNGTFTDSNVPVQVSDISDACEVTVGTHHALALRSNGTVAGWGNPGLGFGTGPIVIQGVCYISCPSNGCNNPPIVSAGADAQTYYGYAPNQSITKTASVTGGTGPYSYSWSLNRPLVAGETLSGETTAAVTVTLKSDAELCITVTDANNCTATDCATINAEDVRCFAGNSGNHKVTVCHNGHNICVDYNAVPAHLAHGDYIGGCVTTRTANSGSEGEDVSGFTIFPNPSGGDFYIQRINPDQKQSLVTVKIINSNGQLTSKFVLNNQTAKRVSIQQGGLYIIQFISAGKTYSRKVLITR